MSGPVLPILPEAVLRLSAEEADQLLSALEDRVPSRPPLEELPEPRGGVAVVFGDTHGDWRSALEAVHAFDAAGPSAHLVGLGDYVDRSPRDLPAGSVANVLFLLSLVAAHPERVHLLQGNHETVRRIGVAPHSLPAELRQLWGPLPERYSRLLGLLERGPIAATTPSGAYLAHAGFPQGTLPSPWSDAVDPTDESRLAEIVWAECERSSGRRGASTPWGEAELERFLGATGLATVWRGHDPDLVGQPLYDDRVMTLHTTRVYQRYGGILFAELPLDRPLRSVSSARVHHLATEGVR